MATSTGSGGLGLLFANLEKFTGSNLDLVAWLRQFDRCCVVANKTEDAIKGQLLMLCVTGQAKAIPYSTILVRHLINAILDFSC